MSFNTPKGKERDTNRFTITDYIDRDAVPVSSSPEPPSTSASTAFRRLPSIPNPNAPTEPSPIASSSRSPPPQVILAPAVAVTKERSASSSSMTASSSRLRLHQPVDRPTFPPSTLTTSPTHPLSPAGMPKSSQPLPSPSSDGFGFGRMSPASSDIRPLPSIPRSYSSARSIDSEPRSMLSPTTHTGGRSGAHSPPLTPMAEDDMSSALSPPVMSHRHSAMSGVSGVSGVSGISNAWTTQDHEHDTKEKEHDFTAAPALNRGVSGTKSLKWWDRWFPASLACKLLLLTVVLETIIDLAIEGNILWRFNEEVDSNDLTDLNFERKRRLPIYLVIYGLAHLWQLVIVVIAIRTRNTVQVIAVTAFNFAFLGYAVIQIYELRQILGGDLEEGLTDVNTNESLLTLPLNILTGIVIGVVATGCVILLILAFLLRREFGWERYRFLGADLRIRAYYTRFQIFECLCYFSAFFCAGFGIQFIWLVLQKTDVEYIITWVAFPLLILLLVLGRWAAKYENVYGMAIFMLGLIAGCAYFIFKLVRIWQEEHGTYYRLTKSLTVFDALSLASLGACFVCGVIVWRDFGKGLKEAVLNKPKASSLHSAIGMWGTKSKTDDESSRVEVDMAQRRISID